MPEYKFLHLAVVVREVESVEVNQGASAKVIFADHSEPLVEKTV